MDRKRWAFPLVGVAAARTGGDDARRARRGRPGAVAARRRGRRGDAAPGDGVQGRRRAGARAARACGALIAATIGARCDRASSSPLSSRPSCCSPPAAAVTTTRPRAPTDTTPAAATGTVGGGESGCEDVEAPEPRPEGTLTAPTEPLGPGTYTAVVTTNCGAFTIALDPEASPKTAASFVALAEDGFFDEHGLPPDRPGLRDPGRRPDGDRHAAGPATQTVDTPAPSTTYTFGTVAMAKAGDEPPGTAGSQFFVVTAQDAQLPADYAVIGRSRRGRRSSPRSACSATRPASCRPSPSWSSRSRSSAPSARSGGAYPLLARDHAASAPWCSRPRR